MRTIVYERYGAPDVLQLREAPEPSAQPGWARVRVHAVGLNPKDTLQRRGKLKFMGRRLPRRPGYDVAGVLLDDAGPIAKGTAVFAMLHGNDGGACADVISVREDLVVPSPSCLSMVEAASLPLAGLTALQAIRDKMSLPEGSSILINGASGGVGTLAIQVAKARSLQVTAVCSYRNLELVRRLGADEVIDYTKESPAGKAADGIFDVHGSLPWKAARVGLRSAGAYCCTTATLGNIVRGALQRVRLHRAALVVVRSHGPDLELVAEWVKSGQLKPVIDSVFPLEQSAEAHARVESNRAGGKVVLTLIDSSAKL